MLRLNQTCKLTGGALDTSPCSCRTPRSNFSYLPVAGLRFLSSGMEKGVYSEPPAADFASAPCSESVSAASSASSATSATSASVSASSLSASRFPDVTDKDIDRIISDTRNDKEHDDKVVDRIERLL